VLYDAAVLPDGQDAVERLAADGRVLEFLKDQYRHCKPLLVLGASSALLEDAGIPSTLPSGEPDPGLLLATPDKKANESFLAALAAHRHYARETDPPLSDAAFMERQRHRRRAPFLISPSQETTLARGRLACGGSLEAL